MTDRRQLVSDIFDSLGALKRCISFKKMPGGKTIGLNRPQLELLFYLNCTPGKQASIKQLVEITQTSSSAVTQLVETLESHGYVERRHDTQDRRVVLVAFTGKGHQKLEALHQDMIDALLKITEDLTDEELKMLTAAHKKIARRTSDY